MRDRFGKLIAVFTAACVIIATAAIAVVAVGVWTEPEDMTLLEQVACTLMLALAESAIIFVALFCYGEYREDRE